MGKKKKKQQTKVKEKAAVKTAEKAVPAASEKLAKAAEKNSSRAYNHKNGFEVLSKYRGAVMGFAALWILFFHEWQYIFHDKFIIGEVNVEAYVKRIGFCGVDIFLFLSGIGLTFAIGKGGLLSFYYRRLKRVFLPFFIVGAIRAVTEKWTPDSFWKNVLCINFYKVSMYSFLWFVPAILTLYLLFPFYYKIFEKASNKLAFTGAMFVLWMGLSLWFRADLRQDLYGFTNRIPVFIFGVYAGWATKNNNVEFTKTSWFVLIVTLVTGLYFGYLANFVGVGFTFPVSNCSIPNLLIGFSFPFVMAKGFDVLCRCKYTKYFGNGLVKILGFFGLFSLELYCVQEWLGGKVMQDLATVTSENKAHIANFRIFVVSAVAGFLLYLVVKYFWKLVDWCAERVIKAIKKTA